MKRSSNAIVRALHNTFFTPAAPSTGRSRRRYLRLEQLECRRVLTVPATQIFAEGDVIVYNGPTVDSAFDSLSFDAFIDFAGDVDSYFFSPQFTGTYTFDVGDFGNTVDPEVAIYDAITGTQLGYNDDLSAVNDDAQLIINLTADVRYIVLVADQPATTAGNVSIVITAPFRTGSFLLTPDAFGDASAAVLLDVPTDIDYYSIVAPPDATGGLTITTKNSTFNQRLALFNSSGTLIQGPLQSLGILTAVANQEYRIAVYSASYASAGTLDLVVDFADQGANVTNTLDSGPGSLRQAILDANAHPNAVGIFDRITFAIPGAGPHLISLASALPTIADPVDINGGTQAGTGTTPTVAIDGSALGGGSDGLRITANGTAIRKLNIRNFPSDGIQVQANSVVLEGNTIGTDWGGLLDFGNAQYGIRIQSGVGNQVTSNVVSGNGLSGIAILGEAADNNELVGNVIGARFGGNNALPNSENGIVISNGDGNQIHDNLISGNALAGIALLGTASNNLVTRNKIGTKFGGTAALPNGGNGIQIESPQNQIGGNKPTLRNIISGNGLSGISISGAAATSNVVEGNYVGLNLSGTAAIPNAVDGVRVISAANNRIGSATDAAAGNVISGNSASGIAFSHAGSAGGLAVGNFIGTTANGLSALGNGSSGVLINAGATQIQIGAASPTARNVISANGSNGITIGTGSNNNRISRNTIGTNVSGAALGNGGSGIQIQSSSNIIGGATAAFANTIAGNTHGITLSGASAINNKISFNTIGTTTVGNVGRGIQIVSNSSGNTIGPSNTIRRNESGIRINDGSIENEITRNSISNNTNLGIDLLPAIGATANDRNDADGGANLLQNWPNISGSPLLIGADLEIAFSVLSSPANAAYPLTVEFFVSDGGGEGTTFVGSTIYTTADFTAGSKSVNFAGAGSGLIVGVSKIVGMATDANGNSSEFSSQRNVAAGGARLSAAASQNTVSQDVNRDGVLNTKDALQLISFVNSNSAISSAGKLTSPATTNVNFDVNGDKVVSSADVLIVVQSLLKDRGIAATSPAVKPTESKAVWDAVLLSLVDGDLADVKKALSQSKWINT